VSGMWSQGQYSQTPCAACGFRGSTHTPHVRHVVAGAVLTDPMCGSGTFLVEGVLMALGVAPNLKREFWPFAHWPDFDARAWREVVEQARAAPRQWKGKAMGCDVNEVGGYWSAGGGMGAMLHLLQICTFVANELIRCCCLWLLYAGCMCHGELRGCPFKPRRTSAQGGWG
jgi:hypothetical protein